MYRTLFPGDVDPDSGDTLHEGRYAGEENAATGIILQSVAFDLTHPWQKMSETATGAEKGGIRWITDPAWNKENAPRTMVSPLLKEPQTNN